MRQVLSGVVMLALAGCGAAEIGQSHVTAPGIFGTPGKSIGARVRGLMPGAAQWEGRKDADAWTEATMLALESDGVMLMSQMPADIMTYCPGYAAASTEDRKAFWLGLLSATARFQSGWNPLASSGGGSFKGLMAISDQAAKAYDCAGDMLDGAANMQCAVKILADTVVRDGAIAGDGKRGWLGVAKSWLPFQKDAHREEIASFTRKQKYCGG